MKKILFFIFTAILLYLTFYISSADGIPSEIYDIVPDEYKEYMPSGDDAFDSVSSADSSYILSLSALLIKKTLSSILKIFVKVTIIMIFAILSDSLAKAFFSSVPKIHNYICSLAVSSVVFSLLSELFASFESYFTHINKFCSLIGIAMAVIYMSCGNAATSIASSAGCAVIATVIEKVCVKYLVPILKLCFASSIASTVSGSLNLKKLSGFIKKCFLTLIVFIMTVVSITFAFQTSIASASDSVATRSLRYAAISSIPIVGGAVGESLRTLSAGLALTKKVCGAYGIIAVIVTSLFPLSLMIGTKIALGLSETFTSLFDSDISFPVISESVSIINFMIAVTTVFAVVFIFILSLFMNCAVAIGV